MKKIKIFYAFIFALTILLISGGIVIAEDKKVDVCHKTGSDTNPWEVISINENGWGHGHEGHEDDFLYTGGDIADQVGWCASQVIPPTPKSTLVANKIVCENESDLPNWGEGDADITSSTASTFLASHQNCKEVPWTFEWIESASEPSPKTDDAVSLDGWTSFSGGSDDTIPVGKKIWVREQFDGDYIPFTGANTTEDVSAELYCDSDVLNYDNLEYIDTQKGATYYCVAFNVKENPVVTKQCNIVSDTTNIVKDEEHGNYPAVEAWDEHPNWIKETVLDPAKWIWSTEKEAYPDQDDKQTFVKQFTVGDNIVSADIQIAADNLFYVAINGNEVEELDHFYNGYVSDGDFNHLTGPVSVRDYLHPGLNTIEIAVKNLEMIGGTYDTNPAGLLYNLEIFSDECSSDIPEEPTASTVTMCKTDDSQNPLANWTLMLLGDKVGGTSVLPNGSEYTVSGVPAGNYVVEANGSYHYRNTEGATDSDAAYSERAPSDIVYTSSTQSEYLPWVRENDFPTSVKGWLGIIMNDAFTDWGSIYNPSHEYALSTSTSNTGDMSFKIKDDDYSDNTGSLSVDVYNGNEGLTGENGCVTFSNVPYGDYNVDEIMKDGWSNVSGLGLVTVDQPEETFNIVNYDDSITTPIVCGTGYESSDNQCVPIQCSQGTHFVENSCVADSCSDRIQNQDETGVDTGGVCAGTPVVENQSPVANAGPDQQITFPTNSVILNGSGSSDPDGTIISYVWSKVSGPSNANPNDIVSPHVNGLVAGTYVFKLIVTDDDGATSSDTVSIKVNRHNTLTGSYVGAGSFSSGQVLGASTSCGLYIDKYLRKGYNNDIDSVKKIQKFLNDYMSAGITEDGIFGEQTEIALKAFQLKHADKILIPWNIEIPTGIFYLTTQTEVNNIMCPDLDLGVPSDLIPFSQNTGITNA